MSGRPQQTCGGTITSKPFRSRTCRPRPRRRAARSSSPAQPWKYTTARSGPGGGAASDRPRGAATSKPPNGSVASRTSATVLADGCRRRGRRPGGRTGCAASSWRRARTDVPRLPVEIGLAEQPVAHARPVACPHLVPGPGCSSRRSSRRPDRPWSTARSPSSSRRSRSGEAWTACRPPGDRRPSRYRWACGPTYLGPGKRSVTRATGQTVLQTLHLRQASALRPIDSAAAAWTISAMVIRLPSPGPGWPAASGRRPGPANPRARGPPAPRSRSPRPRRIAGGGSVARPAGCHRPARSRRAVHGRPRVPAGAGDRRSGCRPSRADGPPGRTASLRSQASGGGASTGRPRTVSTQRAVVAGATSPPPARPPVARTTDPADSTNSRAAAGATSVTRPPIAIDRAPDGLADLETAAEPPEGGSQRACTSAGPGCSAERAAPRTAPAAGVRGLRRGPAAWSSRPRTAGRAIRPGARAQATHGRRDRGRGPDSRHAGSSKARAMPRPLRLCRRSRSGSSTLMAVDPGRRSRTPPGGRIRARLAAIASGQKSLEARRAADDERLVGAPRVERGGHPVGHDRDRTCRADGRRQRAAADRRGRPRTSSPAPPRIAPDQSRAPPGRTGARKRYG